MRMLLDRYIAIQNKVVSLTGGLIWGVNGQSADDRYVNVTGDTMTGALNATESTASESTPSAGSVAGIVSLFNLGSASPSTHIGSIYSNAVRLGHVFARKYADAGGAISPTAALTAHIESSHATGDGVALFAHAKAMVNNAVAFGANLIATATSGLTTPKLVGLEIDVMPVAGEQPDSASGGLFLNVFNQANVGPGILFGGASNGTWTDGIVLNGIGVDDAGLTVQASATEMEWGIYLNNGTYGTAAAQFGAQNDKPALILNEGVAGSTTNPLMVQNAAGSHTFVRSLKGRMWLFADTGADAELTLYDATDGGWTFVVIDGVLSIATVGTGGTFVGTKLQIDAAGNVTIPDLAGVGSRTVVADANGVLSAP